MSQPAYHEDRWAQHVADVREAYRAAGREPDDAYPIHPVRTMYDYATGALSFDAATRKRLTELRRELGLDAPPAPMPHAAVLPFSINGRVLYSGDRPFRWRGITAFALPAMVAQRREAEARAWMTARRDQGFNLFRVLAMCEWLGLSSVDGRFALIAVCKMARELGVALEVVALSDTKAFDFDDKACVNQVRAVGEIVGRELPGTGLVQAANEAFHPTHISWLHDAVNVDYLALQIPADVIGTASTSAVDEDLAPRGDYVTRHLDRGRDLWNMVRRVRELEAVSASTRCYTVNDEPIGAAEAPEPGRRCADPAIFFTFGVLGRIFEVGSTFHCEAGLRCDDLGPLQTACADAFVYGASVIPDDKVLTFKNATWADSPVKDFDTTAAVRVYSGIAGQEGWTVALGLTGDPRIRYQLGWAPDPEPIAQYPGVTVWRITI